MHKRVTHPFHFVPKYAVVDAKSKKIICITNRKKIALKEAANEWWSEQYGYSPKIEVFADNPPSLQVLRKVFCSFGKKGLSVR